jgi:hypothetical protein
MASSIWTRTRSSAPDIAIVGVVALVLALGFAVVLFGP